MKVSWSTKVPNKRSAGIDWPPWVVTFVGNTITPPCWLSRAWKQKPVHGWVAPWKRPPRAFCKRRTPCCSAQRTSPFEKWGSVISAPSTTSAGRWPSIDCPATTQADTGAPWQLAATHSIAYHPPPSFRRRRCRLVFQVRHETPTPARRRPGRTDHRLRPAARMHRLRPGCPPQPADGPVRRLYHLHPDRLVGWAPGHDLRRRRVDGRGDRRTGGATRRAVPARHRAAGRADHARLRPAAAGQAGAHGAASGDARLRQRPGDHHRPGPTGTLQERRNLAERHAAVPDERAGIADHSHRLPATAPDPQRAAGTGGDPQRGPGGVPARPADPHPRRYGTYRRRPAGTGPAANAMEPGNPADRRPVRVPDGHGRPAGNPADPEPDRRDHRKPRLPGSRMRGIGRSQYGFRPVRRHGRLRHDRPDRDQPQFRWPRSAVRDRRRGDDPAVHPVPLALYRTYPAGRPGGSHVRGCATDLRLGLAAGPEQGAAE